MFALPNSALDHNSNYSTLSGWNGAPAPTGAQPVPAENVNSFYNVFDVKSAAESNAPQPQAYDAKAYGGVFSAKNVDTTAYTTKNIEPAVYTAGDAKAPVYPVYSAPYTAGMQSWNPAANAPWGGASYAYA